MSAFSRLPSWIPQTATLVVVYFVVMAALTVWMPVWHDADVAFFQWLGASHASALSPEISVVDVRSWNTADIPANRRTMAAFLAAMVARGQHPRGVVFDVEFDPCQSQPCDAAMVAARSVLVSSLDAAAAAGIKVYATEEVPVDATTDTVIGPPDPRDGVIYAHLAGTAHTRFTIKPGSRFLSYRVCYAPGGGLNYDLWSMVSRVLPEFDSNAGCDTEHRAVQSGASLQNSAALYSIAGNAPFPAGASFGDKYVIIGTLTHDRPQYADRSGPELLAWALSDQLQRQASIVTLLPYYQTSPQNGMLLFLVPAFSAITVLAFTAFFFLIRRLQLRSARRFVPWLSAGAACVAGLAVFAGFEYWLLLSHQIQPQVTLISIGILLAALLSGVRGGRIEFELRSALESSPLETYDYDVFISYAHDEGAWVFDNIYRPLRDARLADGSSLSIFYDTSTIRVGEAWQDEIALAIDASRFIVPLYSEIYFQKPYCRFEIKRAHRKWINAGESSRCVMPVMRGHPEILAAVDDIQGISIDDQPDVMKQIVTEIVAHISRQPQTTAPALQPIPESR